MPRRPRRDTSHLNRTWLRSRRAEVQFARALRNLARRCGEMTREMFDPSDLLHSSARLRSLLQEYAQTLRPWAQEVAKRMVLDVKRRDEAFWAGQSKLVARNLKAEIASAPTQSLLDKRMNEAAALVTSLPLEAAQRIEKFTLKAMVGGERTPEVVKEIMRTGHVTRSRAELIARTESSRTATALVELRSRHIGVMHYRWRAVMDADTRQRHRELNGQVFDWDHPPIAGERGERAHPGGIYRCRCYAEIIFDQEFVAEAA